MDCLCENNCDYCSTCELKQVERDRDQDRAGTLLTDLTDLVDDVLTEHGLEPAEEYERRTR